VRRVVVSIHASLRDADSCGASLSQFMRPDGTRGACCAPLSLNSCVLNSCVPTGRGFVRRVVVSIHASRWDADRAARRRLNSGVPMGRGFVRRVVVSIHASLRDAGRAVCPVGTPDFSTCTPITRHRPVGTIESSIRASSIHASRWDADRAARRRLNSCVPMGRGTCGVSRRDT